jgi:ribonuclease BN (tRNA processing enzyme)
MFPVRFWGVRGSIPCPGRDTVEFGGNTACLEIRADKRVVIVDLGTGVRLLGDYLVANDLKTAPLDMDIFLSHTHWDHIMGLPMFAPLFFPRATMRICGPVSFDDDSLESIISTQLSYKYWPIRHNELAANITYHELKETTIDMGEGLKLTTKYLNHPILTLGYRFEYQGKTIVTVFDHEPFRNLFPTNPDDPNYDELAAMEGEVTAREENEKTLYFYRGADVLIHDAQYTDVEATRHMGWGHSSYEHTIEAVSRAEVKKLVFFHHDPRSTDAQLQSLEDHYRNIAAGNKSFPEITMAREGLVLET